MRVRADERVRIRLPLAVNLLWKDNAREVLEIDLVHDSHIGRNDRKIVERRLSPAQERVALAIALKLEDRVRMEGVGRAELIDLNGMVDDKLRRLQRIDRIRIAAEALHGITHRGKIDDGRNAGEVLHQHTRGSKRNFARWSGRGLPLREKADFVLADRFSILRAQQIFQQNSQRIGQVLGGDSLLIESVKTINLILPIAYAQRRACSK